MSFSELITLIIGIALTVMVFSYILGDRLFFGIATHILIGVSAGFLALVAIQKIILPYLIMPLTYETGTDFFLVLVPLALSILLVLMLFRRGTQAGSIPLAFLGGALAALAIIGVTRGTLAPQILSTVGRFAPEQLMHETEPQWSAILEALMILLGVIAVLFVFHHRGQSKAGDVVRPVFLEGIGSIGQIFIGITFGALFVGLFSSALIALISSLSEIIDFITLWF
ncbi:MAG TPA: hypothetical protein PLO13_02855 [Anaerolineaceae bacterium]|nr:hypothetical protein [Anaerolineaceae bacterium]